MEKQTFYDKVPFDTKERKQILRDLFKKVLDFDSLKDKKIIDVGCAVGTLSNTLLELGGDVYAIDISKEEISLAKERNPNLHAFVADALGIPFDDNEFDIAIANGVLHHTKNCRKGFKETARIVKKGGDVIVSLYIKYHPYPFIYKFARLFTKNKDPSKIPRSLVLTFKYFFNILGKELSYQEVNNHLADVLYTPIATFHSKKQVEKWGQEEGLKLLYTKVCSTGWLLRLYHFKKVK